MRRRLDQPRQALAPLTLSTPRTAKPPLPQVVLLWPYDPREKPILNLPAGLRGHVQY